MQTERRAESPFDAVADHRSAQRARNREPDAHSGSIAFARLEKSDEQRTGYSSAVIINRSEIGGSQNAGRLRKRLLAAGARFNGSSGQLFRR
jgi:hypothetical protein